MEGDSAPTPSGVPIANAKERLSLPLPARVSVGMLLGGGSGFALGLAKGSSDSGLRFQAENSHRLPTTQTGWFLYHKSKNYNMMLGGIVEGVKQGFKYSLWVSLFFLLEGSVDRGRAAAINQVHRVVNKMSDVPNSPELYEDAANKQVGTSQDCLSSLLAGIGTAGFFSAWNRFPFHTAARTAKMGAKAGLAFGLSQDMLSLLKGQPVSYVEFIKRHTIGLSSVTELGSKALN